MEHTFEAVLQGVTRIIADNLRVDQAIVLPDSDLIDDLHADSLDALSITLAIQSEIGVSISDEQMAQFRSARKIASALIEQLALGHETGRAEQVPQQI